MDETSVYWQALPDHGFGSKGQQCKGGKKSKQRVTVAFFISAAGKKEKPIFIWKSENPRCLHCLEKSLLPVSYFSQNKAWMTGAIMEAVLTKLNNQLSSSGRSIILLMDNAGCHPGNLAGKFSNIKVVFFATQHHLYASAFRSRHHTKFQGPLSSLSTEICSIKNR